MSSGAPGRDRERRGVGEVFRGGTHERRLSDPVQHANTCTYLYTRPAYQLSSAWTRKGPGDETGTGSGAGDP